MADFRIAIGAEAEAGKEKGPVTLIVEDATSGGRLAAGPADLRVEAWRKAARRRGGWIPVQSSGALTIRLAPAHGIWAIPFFGALVVQVFDNGEPVAGANVELTSEAADIRQDATRLLTDVRGIAVAELAPREHTAFVRATARSREGKQGVWYGTLPVLPGALHAALVQDELLVESPIPRRIAYYSVVSETGRHTGGSLRLTTNQRGGASGRVQYAALPPGPLWAVVSSEAELDNHAAVGWPLRTRSDEIAYTFDVSDQLLLDGVPRAEANEVTRRRRARWLAVLVCLLAAILIGVLFVTTARSANRTLDAHLKTAGRDIDGVERVAKAHAWQTASVAVLCVALGFAVLALIALYRLS